MGIVVLGKGSPDNLKKSKFFKLNIGTVDRRAITGQVSNWLAERIPGDEWEVRYHPAADQLVIRIDDHVVATEFYLTFKQ